MPSLWAARMMREPLVRRRLLGRDDLADAVDQHLGAAARQRVEAGVAQARQRLGRRQAGLARDVLDLGGRERVQVDRVARLDRAEQVLVPVDAQVGVVAALHEDRRPAQRQRLLDLLEDHRPRQHVALAGVARSPVEGAERAVGVADVRVVQVSVDDERDDAGVGPPVSQLVGRPADRDEVARPQELGRVVVGDPLALERARSRISEALIRPPRRARRTAAPAPSPARRPGGRARRSARRPAARAGRSGSAASRSSGRGTRPASRTRRAAWRASASGSERATASERRWARSSSRRPSSTSFRHAHTAYTIGRPVRSCHRRPRS